MYAGWESVAVLLADGQGSGDPGLHMPSWLGWLLFVTFGAGFTATVSVGAFNDIARQLAEHSRLTRGLSTALYILGAATLVIGTVAVVTLGLRPEVFTTSVLCGSYATWMGYRLNRVSFELTDGHTDKLMAEQALREKTITNDRAEFELEQEQRDSDLARRERAAQVTAQEIKNQQDALDLGERLRALPPPRPEDGR